jgi:hypothetical protein
MTVLETVNDLITNKKIPALEPIQMLALLQYVFTLNSVSARTRIAEVVCRHDRDHPKAFELFLTSTLPLVHRPVATAQEVN